MTKPRTVLKNIPQAPMPKQFLATGMIVIAGLLIFLLIGVIGPKSTGILQASREFDNQNSPDKQLNGVPSLNLGTRFPLLNSRALKEPLNLDLTKGYILSDQDSRISDRFQVPGSLKKETALWFDLFTKYSENTWLIITDNQQPVILEEWPMEKILIEIGPGPSTTKVHNFLTQRRNTLLQTQAGPLRIQKGMKEAFQAQVEKQQRWLPTIEKMFAGQKLPPELTRIFFIPGYLSRDDSQPPWNRLKMQIGKKYLLKSDVIDEYQSPAKVARAMATALNKQFRRDFSWNQIIESSVSLDAAFYAGLHAEYYWNDLELQKIEATVRRQMKAFRLSRATKLGLLAKNLRVRLALLIDSNPDIVNPNADVVLPANYVFFIAQK